MRKLPFSPLRNIFHISVSHLSVPAFLSIISVASFSPQLRLVPDSDSFRLGLISPQWNSLNAFFLAPRIPRFTRWGESFFAKGSSPRFRRSHARERQGRSASRAGSRHTVRPLSTLLQASTYVSSHLRDDDSMISKFLPFVILLSFEFLLGQQDLSGFA